MTMITSAPLGSRHDAATPRSTTFPHAQSITTLIYNALQWYGPGLKIHGAAPRSQPPSKSDDYYTRETGAGRDATARCLANACTSKPLEAPCLQIHGPKMIAPGNPSGANRGGGKRRDGGSGKRRTAGGGPRSGATRSLAKSASRSSLSQRYPVDNDSENDGDETDESKSGDDDSAAAPNTIFACPFYKFDPSRHFKHCQKLRLKSYEDVKNHIIRRHTLTSLYCPNCWRSWVEKKRKGWQRHVRRRDCVVEPEPEGLLSEEKDSLMDLDVVSLSNENKWYRMWELLFAGHQAPSSPFINPDGGEIRDVLLASADAALVALPGQLLAAGVQLNDESMQSLCQQIHSLYTTPLATGQAKKYRRQNAILQRSMQRSMQPPMLQPISQSRALSMSQLLPQSPFSALSGYSPEFDHFFSSADTVGPVSPVPDGMSAGADMEFAEFDDFMNLWGFDVEPTLEMPAVGHDFVPTAVELPITTLEDQILPKLPVTAPMPPLDLSGASTKNYELVPISGCRSAAEKACRDIAPQTSKTQMLAVHYRCPSLTRQDLFMLRLNRKWSLGRDMVWCIGTAPDQMRRIEMALAAGTSSKSVPRQVSVVVGVDWPLRRFLRAQFVDAVSRRRPFGSLIALTGYSTDAQALTAHEYLSQTWPAIVGSFLRLLPAVLDPCLVPVYTRQDIHGTAIKMFYEENCVLIRAVGDAEIIIQILQAFTWIASAARSGPAIKGVWDCVPIFSHCKPDMAVLNSQTFVVHFFLRPIPLVIQPGTCWQHMFQGAVIARGFPIPQRTTKGLGLEMPLNMMAELGGSRRVTEWNDTIFIKGYSTMLVAIKSLGDALIWHYYYTQSGTRVSYMDCTVEAERMNGAMLGRYRHIIGWCSRAKYCAGSPDAKYDIGESRLPRPSAGIILDKLSISAGSIIRGGATITPGTKELPPHLSRNGRIPKLKWLSRRYFIFWDEGVKAGWLVNGTSALLHILRASLSNDEKSTVRSCLMFDKTKINDDFAQDSYKHDSAMRVLVDPGNQGLPVYLDSITQRQDTILGSSSSTSTQTANYFLFGDLVMQHASALEQIIDFHMHVAGRDGINLKPRFRKHLEGWDFADLAREDDPQPRIAEIPTIGHGWVDFVRSIGAVALFGRGFGELLQPADAAEQCGRWRSLPPELYLLAASVADLTVIMKQHGDPHATPRELARSITWYSPASTFARCPCTLRPDGDDATASNRCHQSLIQLLLPAGTKSRLPPSQSVLELEPDGAVVFGHNTPFGYRWPDMGTVEMPDKDFPVPWQKMSPMRLFSKKSDGTDTDANRSDTDAASRPDSDDAMDTSESSTSTPPTKSPPSQRSGLLGLLKKKRGCSLEESNAFERKKHKTDEITAPKA